MIHLRLGDSFEMLKGLPDASLAAVVTDPPYGISFMSKEWDDPTLEVEEEVAPTEGEIHSFQAWAQGWLRLCFEKMTPGGSIKVFGATRTFHRMAAAMENVGFKDLHVEAWAYGSGFPKSLNVSKALDRAAGASRTEKIGVKAGHENFVGRDHIKSLRETGVLSGEGGYTRPWMFDPQKVEDSHYNFAPATEAAKQWDGWGTALKPAWEPFIVGRKPL